MKFVCRLVKFSLLDCFNIYKPQAERTHFIMVKGRSSHQTLKLYLVNNVFVSDGINAISPYVTVIIGLLCYNTRIARSPENTPATILPPAVSTKTAALDVVVVAAGLVVEGETEDVVVLEVVDVDAVDSAVVAGEDVMKVVVSVPVSIPEIDVSGRERLAL